MQTSSILDTSTLAEYSVNLFIIFFFGGIKIDFF
jgi:hypothetical protein